ncbi:gram-negative bacteria-binding protein 2 [Musca vetustissima]|uniref:gram-negative bacteria-binding protein 2 n=1 Tax=Musca vetustissima TaxID=27455 RepID=UPI002AB6C21D|nr:gram-negative bacteria-binding protein 2 [Musca vetustissima]
MKIIPSDDPGIRKVIYYIKINDKCPGYMDLVLEGNPVWKITQTSNTPLKDKDKINISILVDHNGEAYKDKQYIVVGENNNVAIKTPNNTPTTPCGGISGDEKPQPPTEVCEPSQTIVKGLKKICKNQLIFEENFNDAQIDLSKWSFGIRNLLTARQNEEFVLYDNSHENIFIADGILNIKPTFTQVNARMAAIDFGSRCTPVENNIKECKASTQFPFNYVPPINSSNINTRNTFQFKYGRVEIRAKLPKGNWLLPYITLENYGTFQRRQMRIAFARGNEQLLITNPMKDIGGRRLYGGLVKYFDQYENNLKELYANEHFGNDFHIYTLTWTNNSIAVSVDGRTYGEFQENLNEFNDEFFISVGVSAGGHLEFPDTLVNPEHKPWKNTSPKAIGIFWQNIKDGLISWADDNQTMRIDYVRVYAV